MEKWFIDLNFSEYLKIGKTFRDSKFLKSLMCDKSKVIQPRYKNQGKELGKSPVAASMEEKIELILDKVEQRNYKLGKQHHSYISEQEIKYLEKLKEAKDENDAFITSTNDPNLDDLIKQNKREVLS